MPADIAALPDAQGYGRVRDLHQAMDIVTAIDAKTTDAFMSTSSSSASNSRKCQKRPNDRYREQIGDCITPPFRRIQSKKRGHRKVDIP
ncbi:hypothetical protein [Hydrogenophaga sp.]|uniref:hypothetical protein n=1 Tax=Hydrogenophaga sp. TaxID=1904254 RepID=UPI003D111ABB